MNDTFAVTLTGPMLCCRKALKPVADGSSIVFISSIAALRSGSQLIAYDASKAALGGLMRNVAKEGAGVGSAPTSSARAWSTRRSAGTPAPAGRRERGGRPVRAMATGWEIAYAALFFISDESVTLRADAGGLQRHHRVMNQNPARSLIRRRFNQDKSTVDPSRTKRALLFSQAFRPVGGVIPFSVCALGEFFRRAQEDVEMRSSFISAPRPVPDRTSAGPDRRHRRRQPARRRRQRNLRSESALLM